MTKSYIIYNDQENTSEIVDLREDCYFEQALIWVGFYLERKDGGTIQMDDDEIKEYSLFDETDDSLVFNFFEGYYENACLKALTELGYSVEELEEASNVVEVNFAGV